jgi:hypothetical protein
MADDAQELSHRDTTDHEEVLHAARFPNVWLSPWDVHSERADGSVTQGYTGSRPSSGWR